MQMNNKTCFIYLFEPKPRLHPGRQVAAAKQWAGPQVHLQPWITANPEHRDFSPCTSRSLLGWTSAWLKEIKRKAALPNHGMTTQCWRRTLKSQCLCKCWLLSARCCFETCILPEAAKKKLYVLTWFIFFLIIWDGKWGHGFRDLEIPAPFREPSSTDSAY